jgi:chromosome segregation ATPase
MTFKHQDKLEALKQAREAAKKASEEAKVAKPHGCNDSAKKIKELEELQKKIEEGQAAKQALENRLTELQKQVSDKKTENSSLEQAIDELANKIIDLTTTLELQKSNFEALSSIDNEALTNEVNKNKTELELLTKSKNEVNGKVEAELIILSGLNTKNDEWKAEQVAFEEAIGEAEKNIEANSKILSDLGKPCDPLVQEMVEANGEAHTFA